MNMSGRTVKTLAGRGRLVKSVIPRPPEDWCYVQLNDSPYNPQGPGSRGTASGWLGDYQRVGCDSRAVRRHGMRLSQLKRHLVAYVKNRAIKAALTGRDLHTAGPKPGLQYKTILGKLLDARIDGMITTEAGERAYAQKRLGLAGCGNTMLVS